MCYTGWDLSGAGGLKPEPRIDSKKLFDLVKLSFWVVAGAGALVALVAVVAAYRRQQVAEEGALREATRLHTERFATAVGQDSAAVRLGGVHALAGLADDASLVRAAAAQAGLSVNAYVVRAARRAATLDAVKQLATLGIGDDLEGEGDTL
ncbi:hypothetical protein STENM223S_03100 [Streptomyces tendae]